MADGTQNPHMHPQAELPIRPVNVALEQAADDVMTWVMQKNCRVLGLYELDPSLQEETLEHFVVASLAAQGAMCLLLDCRGRRTRARPSDVWHPSIGSPLGSVRRATQGFDELNIEPITLQKEPLGTRAALLHLLGHDLAKYAHVVVCLPKIESEHGMTGRMPIIPSVCDIVLLIGLSGATTRNHLDSIVERMQAANVNVSGIVLNQGATLPLGRDIARAVARMRFLPAPVRSWLQAKFERNSFLNQ
jgi:hypothetical protein